MKRLFLIICFFILTGCTFKKITVENPLSIIYNNNNIVENDYNSIISIINNIKFSCGKQQNYLGDTLIITTNEQVYKFRISSNYYMEFQKSNKYCHTKDTEKVEELVKVLDKIYKKYTDTTFYTIMVEQKYINSDDDIFIKLDKSNDFIIINSNYQLNNFKINEIQFDDKSHSYKEVDLLYSNDTIKPNTNIIIRKEILHNYDFKISFTTPYNYLLTILPILNENNEINYITDIKNS